ncbi:sushi, von Willebrand factor type A, EGF and pentraxin domain-containing protein 1-like isoform X2 [Ruditapes philippinarum]|uniref:sushi, von Willebrand factor type A, EGF and pentraxin domain-containing protein 1-like isoform X2 n=1 Tax=Ruditapes philippinarum TaxID=129788 RepID=UPI00295ADF90|nr:sushi, von Willebrand factor type A, EGF and pentraxin domain-containing protein 1-like isoform X2 [Ruditapes philippinarum]
MCARLIILYVLIFSCKGEIGDELHCSKYHYETQTLERIIKAEISINGFKNDFHQIKHGIEAEKSNAEAISKLEEKFQQMQQSLQTFTENMTAIKEKHDSLTTRHDTIRQVCIPSKTYSNVEDSEQMTSKCQAGLMYVHDSKKCTPDIGSTFQLEFPTETYMECAHVDMEQNLKSATVCFWMKTDDSMNNGTPFSYANEDGDNMFTLTDYNGFTFYVNGEKRTTTAKANTGDWHHICVMWASNRGEWRLYMDGIPMDSGRRLSNGQTIKGGGQFIIGQEQDIIGGGFASAESFIGQISQLNMWSRSLSLRDIESLRQNCSSLMGDVIAWKDVSVKSKRFVTVTTVEFCKACPQLDDIDNGIVTYTDITPGSEASYSCNRGHDLTGRRTRLCIVTGEWEGNDPVCATVQCGHPGGILNGWTEGDRYTYGNRVRYRCERGYVLVGRSTRYCGEFGFWEGDTPICEQDFYEDLY